MSAADGTLVADAPGAEREFNVPYVTRVEGEGSLVLRVRDREVRRGPPEDLRGAALLRADRGGPDRRRGHRHRRPHLRDLPHRVPDDRRPRLRGPVRRPRAPGDPVPATPPLLRRVHPEPRAARLPAARAGLSRLPVRPGDGRGSPRRRGAGPRDQEDRQPADLRARWPAGSPDLGPRGGVLPRAVAARPRCRPPGARRRRRLVTGDREPRRLVGSAGVRAPSAARGAAASGRVSLQRRPDRLLGRAGHRARGLG